MNRTGKVLGSVFIVLGMLILLKNLEIIEPFWNYVDLGYIIKRFWPILFFILPGIFFHLSYFSGRKKDAGVLVPGGILLTLGVAFQINMIFGGWDIMWPVYIFSVAVGLFELYAFGTREKGLLIPIGILSGLSVLFFIAFSANELLGFNIRSFIVPIVLIGIGLAVLFGGKGGKGRKEF